MGIRYGVKDGGDSLRDEDFATDDFKTDEDTLPSFCECRLIPKAEGVACYPLF